MREYLVDLCATQAAIRAGYSARTAGSQGERLLKNVEVQRAVAESIRQRAERVEVRADDVLRELLRIGTADLRRLFDSSGALRPMSEWPDDVARAVASVEVVEMPGGEGVSGGVVKKIKLWDKPRCLELLGKHLKLFADKETNSGATTVVVVNPYAEGRGA